MDQHAAGYLPERVQSKVEPGDHAKIAAAATKRPVEVGMLVGAGVHCLPAGQDDLGADKIVDGEAELATDPAHAAAKREPGHARVGCRPGWRDHAVAFGRLDHFTEPHARLDMGDASIHIDGDAFHEREIDHQGAVVDAMSSHSMATAPDRHWNAACSSGVDARNNIVCGDTSGDGCRSPVDHVVEDAPGFVVPGIPGEDKLTLKY